MFRLENAQSLVGVALTLLVCWAMSENRRAFPWRLALGAVLLQVALVALLFGLPGAQGVIQAVNDGVDGLAAARPMAPSSCSATWAGASSPIRWPTQGRCSSSPSRSCR